MPTIINSSDQIFTHYDTQSGSSGNLNNNIPTGNLGQVLTSNRVSAQPTYQNSSSSTSFASINMQIFSTPGSFTYTPTPNMQYCVVEVIGAGGGGGNSIGSGGGSGAYARQTFSAATIGVSQGIAIGTGGAAGAPGIVGGSTVFGSLITCTGGSGGASSTNQNSPFAGGAGGTVTIGGTVTATGGKGNNGMWINLNVQFPGFGGNSFLAPGGHCGNTSVLTGGIGQYGSGGGGGYSGAGGKGGDGLVLITEFISL